MAETEKRVVRLSSIGSSVSLAAASTKPPSMTNRYQPTTIGTKRPSSSLDSSKRPRTGTNFSSTLNVTAETECGSRRR